MTDAEGAQAQGRSGTQAPRYHFCETFPRWLAWLCAELRGSSEQQRRQTQLQALQASCPVFIGHQIVRGSSEASAFSAKAAFKLLLLPRQPVSLPIHTSEVYIRGTLYSKASGSDDALPSCVTSKIHGV